MGEKRKINMELDATEIRFINFVREIGYGELVLRIHDGKPKQALEIKKSFRFDELGGE